MSRLVSAVAIAACICLCGQIALADIVYFKDKTKIEGQVLEYTTERLEIATTHGILQFEVVHILKVMRGDKLLVPVPSMKDQLGQKKVSVWPWLLLGAGSCCALYFLVGLAFSMGHEIGQRT